VASFPMYGFERRGAPVVAFTRTDEKPIREKTQIYNPDCMVVIDPGLMKIPTLFNGLKPEGVLILNSPKPLQGRPHDNLKLAGVINATQIAVEEIGRDIPNTCLLGAFAAATGWVSLQSILSCLGDYLSGDILQRNLRSAERGYREVEVIRW
jgi:pyruvate ferredoxin oxidoreductase gamma subunit